MRDYLKELMYFANSGIVDSSTINIAKDWGISQQSVSRVLKEMEDLSLIKREVSNRGTKIMLDYKALASLNSNYKILKNFFDGFLKGKIVSGIGEGKYYVQCYKNKLIQKLNFEPYEGTLNFEVDAMQLKKFLFNLKKITIESFSNKQRTFGVVECYEVLIDNKIRGAIVVPDRTRHEKNIIEVVAPVSLREKLKKGDDDIIKITKVI